MSQNTRAAATEDPETRSVHVRCTGHVRTAVGESDLRFSFEGETLRDFLDAFFGEYDVRDLLIAETEAAATTRGWAPSAAEAAAPRGAKNPEGEQTRRYARVTVDGVFNEHLDGLDTTLSEGDRIGLLYPFIYCC